MKTPGESNTHYYRKMVIAKQLKLNPGIIGLNEILRIDIESNFSMNGFIMFIPDLAIYTENGLEVLIEVVISNPVSTEKKYKIKEYFDCNGYYPKLYEIKDMNNFNKINYEHTKRQI